MTGIFSYISRLFSSVVKLAGAEGMNFLLTAVFIILFGRLRGPEALGVLSVTFVIVTIVRVAQEGGFDFRIMKEIPEGKSGGIETYQKIKNNIFVLTTLPAALILYFSTHSFSALILLLWNLPTLITLTMKAILKGKGEFTSLMKIEMISTFILHAVNISLLYFYFSLELIFINYFFIETLKAYLLLNEVNKTFGFKYKLTNFLKTGNFNIIFRQKELIKQQLNLTGVNLFSGLYNRSPILILSWIAGSYAVGIYSAAQRFLTVFRIIPQSFMNALIPDFSTDKNIKKLILNLLFAIFTGITAAMAVYFLSDYLILLLFGDKFSESVAILQIVGFSFIPVMTNIVFESYIISLGKEKIINIAILSGAIFIFVVSFFTFSEYGLKFIAILAVSVEYIITLFYLIFIFRKGNSGKKRT